ncbi:hypothetical protein P20429_3302 [Pseudoalteromonas sp. BSi20429]|nr:hypothetical protein P20429_3302 [Pseudoalteromonas sp. BSi20429]
MKADVTRPANEVAKAVFIPVSKTAAEWSKAVESLPTFPKSKSERPMVMPKKVPATPMLVRSAGIVLLDES